MPRLWLKPKGISDSIAVKTADFIMDTAVYCSAHVIVTERFDLKGRKHGSKAPRNSVFIIGGHSMFSGGWKTRLTATDSG